jgi:hypothetical protein
MKKIGINPNIFEEAKSNFIETLIKAIDKEQIKNVLIDQYGIPSVVSVKINHCDLLSYNNKIAYRLEFESSMLLSCLIDDGGNLLDDIVQIPESVSIDKNHVNQPNLKHKPRGLKFNLIRNAESVNKNWTR